ncbi:unnamed protein product, partial [Tetraodon nigroviridis]
KTVDSGAGFFIEEEEDGEEELATKRIVHQPAPVIEPDYLVCDDCQKPFMDSYLSNSFDLCVCDSCRWRRGAWRCGVPKRHWMRPKNHGKRTKSCRDKNGSTRRSKVSFYLKGKHTNINCGCLRECELECVVCAAELRRAVRSSVWTKDTSIHQHQYGPEEVVDPEEDLYKKTCSTCGHELTYEKM